MAKLVCLEGVFGFIKHPPTLPISLHPSFAFGLRYSSLTGVPCHMIALWRLAPQHGRQDMREARCLVAKMAACQTGPLASGTCGRRACRRNCTFIGLTPPSRSLFRALWKVIGCPWLLFDQLFDALFADCLYFYSKGECPHVC